jgi:hypothetical protein
MGAEARSGDVRLREVPPPASASAEPPTTLNLRNGSHISCSIRELQSEQSSIKTVVTSGVVEPKHYSFHMVLVSKIMLIRGISILVAHVWLKRRFFDWKNIHAISFAIDDPSPNHRRASWAIGVFPAPRTQLFFPVDQPDSGICKGFAP